MRASSALTTRRRWRPGRARGRRRRSGPAPCTRHRPTLESAPARPRAAPESTRPFGLPLPADVVGAVVLDGELEGACSVLTAVHRHARSRPSRPGLDDRASPLAQSGHDVGLHRSAPRAGPAPAAAGPSRAGSAPRSMIAAAPTTCAPGASATRAVSRVEPPVVTTSSTTSTRSSRRQREAAAQRQRAVLPLGEQRAHAERARDFLADDDAAERRRQHDRRLQMPRALGERAPERVGELGILQHQRALQVAVAVQPRRQPEVPFEQRAGLAGTDRERRPDPSVRRLAVLRAAGCPRTASGCACTRRPSSSPR